MTHNSRPGLAVSDVAKGGDGHGSGIGAYRVRLAGAKNEGPFGPFESALAAAMDQVGRANRYPQSGAPALRQELASHLGVGIERVVAGAGVTALIHHLSMALLDPGTNIVTSGPSFSSYSSEARSRGATTKRALPRMDGGHDLEGTLGLINDRTRVVYVDNPGNLTGGIVRRNELLRFVERVPTTVTMVVDESYFEYVDSDQYPDTASEAEFHRKNLVTIRTFSHAYGLGGLRVAYLVGSRKSSELLRKCRATTKCPTWPRLRQLRVCGIRTNSTGESASTDSGVPDLPQD
ncbi:aminotransferase class I/II-fold pyridoxal phosphate-dependent enzyme [Arthrobacter sp. 24S4-2]|nr:aminotransferase class I/II-fold pyridoxal phosphate-dependent enzyme [Arthrobacter sp. 24S4-2]QCO98043.1 aminotransferase class I/II-fold pyridoxal phosphate-dependent enzyme [Arthrobacter sp. 24S4-2]